MTRNLVAAPQALAGLVTTPRLAAAALALAAAFAPPAQAFTFDGDGWKGSFDSTLTLGTGMRLADPSCDRVGDLSFCGGAAPFVWSNGDDGNLNYRKGDFFTTYLKGNHELLLKFATGTTVMARGTWLHDFTADGTERTALSKETRRSVVNDARLLDLWVSQTFNLADERQRVRVGNQVVSWGESLFVPGGINATNAMDFQRLSTPGVQLKEVTLPAPMASVATSLGNGLNAEAYWQFGWNRSRFAPVGSYWSFADNYNKGRVPIYLGLDPQTAAAIGAEPGAAVGYAADRRARNNGQYGASLRWQPESTQLNLGIYALNYHDKTPNLAFVNGQSQAQWTFLEDRKLYGVSANLPVGNWAVGTELSYRPKDAIALGSCYEPGAAGVTLAATGNCQQWIDQKRYQLHVTGLLALNPADHGWLLDAVGASTGAVSLEAVGISVPGLKSSYTRSAPDGVTVTQLPAAGLWGYSADGGATTFGVGTRTSWGFVADVNLTWDGTVIPGWQLTPGVTYSRAVKGRTPTFMATWMEGAQSANVYLLFNQNPAIWQAGINYTAYWGGRYSTDQPYADRDFIGAFVSRNF
ncbi:DUF1302 domain-containing protein [Derxia gummosa]|uniref:DUF1302 domain-containing protein n=1 Tax=Derxia gummosa DSM 723 TaxID=1121388 RepID=A0A8B6XB59_9BURK|nr:DUF1302 domain-containing protein [Derxia gummosa]